MEKETRITEQSSLYDHLETKTVAEIIAEINHESAKVPQVIEKALPQLEKLINTIEEKLKSGGRLFYIGCGTGGRLAILDTIEVQNTYGTDPEQIQAIFPGGIGNIANPAKSSEDDLDGASLQLEAKHVSNNDIVVGLSASGTTPFVLAALSFCRNHGIATGSIVSNPNAPISAASDYPVVLITGPEYVTGSTRMKGGTSQKLCLDMISTTVQIRMGRVEGNRMVNAKLLNQKLVNRAVRNFRFLHPEANDDEAVRRLILSQGSVKKAEDYWRQHPDIVLSK